MYSPVKEEVSPTVETLQSSFSSTKVRLGTLKSKVGFLEQNGQRIKDLEEQKQSLVEAKQSLEKKIREVETAKIAAEEVKAGIEGKLAISSQTKAGLEQTITAKKAEKAGLKQQKKDQTDILTQKQLEVKKHEEAVEAKKKVLDGKTTEAKRMETEVQGIVSRKATAETVVLQKQADLAKITGTHQPQIKLKEDDVLAKNNSLQTSNTSLLSLNTQKATEDQKIKTLETIINNNPGLMQTKTQEIKARNDLIAAKYGDNNNKYSPVSNAQANVDYYARQIREKEAEKALSVREKAEVENRLPDAGRTLDATSREKKSIESKNLGQVVYAVSSSGEVERGSGWFWSDNFFNEFYDFMHDHYPCRQRVSIDDSFYITTYGYKWTNHSSGAIAHAWIFHLDHSKYSKAIAEAQQKISVAQSQKTTLENKIQTCSTRISQLPTEISNSESSKRSADIALSNAAAEYNRVTGPNNSVISTLTQQNNQAQAEILALKQALDSAPSQKAAAVQKSAELQKQIIAKQAEISSLQQQHDASKATIDKLKQEIKLAESQETTATADVANLGKDLKTKQDAKTSVDKQITTAQNEMKTLQEQLSHTNQIRSSATLEESRIEAKLQASETELSDMSKLLDTLILLEEKQVTFQSLRSELTAAETSLLQKTSEYESFTSQIEGLNAGNVEQKMQELESQITTLANQISGFLSFGELTIQNQHHQENQVKVVGEAGENGFDAYL